MSLQSAAETAISAAGVTRVYGLNEVEDNPKYPYLVVSSVADSPAAYTLDSRHGLMFERVTTQSFGRTVASARELDSRARLALLNQRLDGSSPGRQQVGAAIVRDPDTDGVVGVTSTYLFTVQETS